ncbi:hypothetical protein AERO8C_20513 [Aeromonas veronii]|uniref:Uncharacterized protein n=1 Tax=Aeromonas veronii TaxID=654 RepID=A0A653L2J8_AERVE|nr:hypothetical protein AERO8C_20513 [Aeromonas veronii]
MIPVTESDHLPPVGRLFCPRHDALLNMVITRRSIRVESMDAGRPYVVDPPERMEPDSPSRGGDLPDRRALPLASEQRCHSRLTTRHRSNSGSRHQRQEADPGL